MCKSESFASAHLFTVYVWLAPDNLLLLSSCGNFVFFWM